MNCSKIAHYLCKGAGVFLVFSLTPSVVCSQHTDSDESVAPVTLTIPDPAVILEGGYVSIVPATLTIPGPAVILEGEYVVEGVEEVEEVEEKAYLPLFKKINSNGKNGISRKEWREYKKRMSQR